MDDRDRGRAKRLTAEAVADDVQGSVGIRFEIVLRRPLREVGGKSERAHPSAFERGRDDSITHSRMSSYLRNVIFGFINHVNCKRVGQLAE